MIVAMSQVLVLGPKRLLDSVVEEIQALGTLHIDRIESTGTPDVHALRLPDSAALTIQGFERALTRVDGLLGLLPVVGEQAVPVAEAGADMTLESVDEQISGLERHVRDLVRRKLELEEEQTLIKAYAGAVRVLAPLLRALSSSKTLEAVGFLLNTADLTVVAALRNELRKVTEGRVEIVSRTIDERRIGVVVAFRRQDADQVRAVLSRAGGAELRLPERFAQPDPAQTIRLMEERRAQIPAERAAIESELLQIATAERSRLQVIRNWLADRLAQLRVVPNLMESRYMFILHGWTPTRSVRSVREGLRARFGQDIVVYDAPADPHHDPERVPVLLDNTPLIRPIQRLLALFRPPRYGAWDPSPVMVVTFPIFVGLVIGDTGYGLLLFLLGWWLRNRARAGKPLVSAFFSLRFPVLLLADMSFLIRLCAFWIILFGAIYAEFFGNLPELLFHVTPLFNRIEEKDLYFLIVIAAGIFMVFLGLLVHFVEALKYRHWVGVFESLVLTLGTAGLLLFLGARGQQLPATLEGIGLKLFLAAVVVAVLSLLVERDLMKRFLWILESTTSFGHILSFARLMAFGFADAALPVAANQLGKLAGVYGLLVGIFVAMLFQTLFLVFTILGHVIQPARLHWVEFFTKFKFHEETGRRYEPFQKASAVRS
jgi:V/A-type H+-transporting ATPase subunit I